MTPNEHKFIMISMRFMLREQVNFGKFFQNIFEEGQFSVEEIKKNRYANLVEMNELPEYSKDKSVIRILWHRWWPLMDVNDDQAYLERLFNQHYEKIFGRKHKFHMQNNQIIP